MFLLIGDCYQYLNNFTLAETNYKRASLVIPHRFTPKYKLFKLYLANANTIMALKIASEIKNMRIKIYSTEIKEIKTEVNDYINKQNQAIESN
jgi:hypothetical protein